MRRKQKSKKNKLSLEKLIFLFVITTVIVTTITFSKYESSVAGNDNTKVAVPIINISSENTVIPISISPVEGEKTYKFSVSNIEEEKQSEVSMEYTLKLQSLGNLPLDFELYKVEEESVGTTNLLSGNGSITDTVQMKLNEDITHTYELKIKWREGETSYLYSQTIDYVQIVVNATQVD